MFLIVRRIICRKESETQILFLLQPLLGQCFFFVRHFSEKPIRFDNVHKDVLFGYIEVENGDLLGAIGSYLSQVMLPSLKATEVGSKD